MVTLPRLTPTKCNFNALAPWLCDNWAWTKRSGHTQRSGCVGISKKCPKLVLLGIFLMFDLLTFSFPCNYCIVWPKEEEKEGKSLKTAFLCYGSLKYATQNLLDGDNVECRLKKRPFEKLKFHDTRTFWFWFSWCKLQWHGDKFNNWSHTLGEQKDDLMVSMM